MKRLISGLPFCNYHYYNCEHRTFDVLVRFYGYETPLILHRNWYFSFRRQENGDFEITSASQPLFQSLARCGVQVVMHEEPTVEAAWRCVVSQISEGHPVPILADQRHLEDYYLVRQGVDGGHYVILDGFDEESRMVHVVDPSPGRKFRGELPFSGFFVENGGRNDDDRPGPNWFELNFSKPRWHLQVEQAFETIRQNVHQMLRGRAYLPDTFIGLHGLQSLAEETAKWRDLAADEACSRMKRLSKCLNTVLMEREGHSDYLKLVADEMDMPDVAPVSEQLRHIVQMWYVLRNVCLKGQIKQPVRAVQKLFDRLVEIESLEERALSQLNKVVEQT